MDEHRLMYELTTTPTDEETGAGRDFDPPGPIARDDEAKWEMSGMARPIDAAYHSALPRRVILHTPKPRVTDFLTTMHLPLVSPRFRDLLEKFEPNRHEFIPIEVELSQFPDLEIAPHFFLNIAKVNDGLDFDRCPKDIPPPPALPPDLLAKYGPMRPRERLSITPGRGRVFNWSAIRGRHMFGVWNKLCAWAPVFLSQELMELCERAEIVGIATALCRPD